MMWNILKLKKNSLPSSESLKNVYERFMPLWENSIYDKIKSGKKVIIVAHGNSLRALVKHLNKISDEDIVKINIPTAIPLVFEIDDQGKAKKNYYLGDKNEINKKIIEIANQGSI